MILRAYFLRPALHRPLRFVVTVLGIAAGVASVVSTVAASRAAIHSLKDGVRELAGRASIEVSRPSGVDEEVLGRLRPFTREAVLEPVLEEIGLVAATREPVRLLGVDFLVDGDLRDLRLEGGGRPAFALAEKLLVGGEVLIPAALARERGLKAGGTLDLVVKARPVGLRVAGVFETRRFGAAWDRVVLLDVASAQELFGRSGRVDRVEVLPRREGGVAGLAGRLRAALGSGFEVRQPAERGESTGRMVRALEFSLAALSGVSLLVGAILVATTLATSVVQRRATLALLVSLGASRRQVTLAVLLEAACMGLLGGALGVALSLVGARLAAAAVRTTVSAVVQGIPATDIHVGPGLALTGAALGLAVSLAAAILPLLEARRTPPIQNLLRERPLRLHRRAAARGLAGAVLCLAGAAVLSRVPPVSNRPVTALLAALAVAAAILCLSPLLLDGASRLLAFIGLGLRTSTAPRIAGAALAAGRRRASWAAGAIGVAVAFSAAVGVFVHSFRTTVVDWSEQGLKADIWLRPLTDETGFQVGRLSPEVVEAAKALFGDGVVDPIHMATAYAGQEPVTLAGGAFPIARDRSGVPFKGGKTPREVFGEALRVKGCVVNEPFALRFHVGDGDTVRLRVRDGEIERKVCGVFYDYSDQRGSVFLNRADFLELYPDDGPTGIFFFLPPDADPSEARARLYRAFAGRFEAEVLLSGDLRREVVAAFDRTFAITRALQALAGAVAVLAVLAVLYALVDERRRDLALLRALGGSRPQVAGVVALQAGILGFVGAVPGLAGGLLMGLLLVKVASLQSFHWTLRFLPPWGDLFALLAWVVAACVAAGALPALKAARSTPREDLHEEG